jgi:hypothetical protein
MFKSKDIGRLTVGMDTRALARQRDDTGGWWPPITVGPYAIWFVPVPWVFVCWQRDR